MELHLDIFGLSINHQNNHGWFIYKTNRDNSLSVEVVNIIIQVPQQHKDEGFKNIMTFEAFKRQVKLVEEE